MTKYEIYQDLWRQYDKAVLELKEIQAAEDKKKKEIHVLINKIEEAIK